MAAYTASFLDALTVNSETLLRKDPDASGIPFGIDWTGYLALLGVSETVSTSSWAITGRDALLTTDDDAIVTGSLKTQCRFDVGTLGVRYTVTNSIVTSSGVVDDRSFDVLIENL